MAKLPERTEYRLQPEDEFTHDPGEVENYNESMYFNAFDHDRKYGGWFRLGNRPNQKYAELSVCIYLPDGRVAFIFQRPEISDNKEMNAGGLRFEVVDPFKTLKVNFEGQVLILDDPTEMADPKLAFKNNPKKPCQVELTYTGQSPMYGGEIVNSDGTPREIDPEKSFAKAHYEQHCSVEGHFTIDGELYPLSGFGLRDKSWGPRHWQAIEWYRWCPMNFGPDFGMMFTVAGDGNGGVRRSGMVFKDGVYDLVVDCILESEWDDNEYQRSLAATVKTESGHVYEVTGEIASLIPLRNRRTTPEGEQLLTRLTEGMTRYECDGRTGYGMSEYLDQIVDGKALGRASGY